MDDVHTVVDAKADAQDAYRGSDEVECLADHGEKADDVRDDGKKRIVEQPDAIGDAAVVREAMKDALVSTL